MGDDEKKETYPTKSVYISGQKECSGICVDYDHNIVYMCSWIDNKSSHYLYKYDLNNENYLGKTELNPHPEWMQGVAYYDGNLYVTCDDGDADKNKLIPI